MARMTFLPSDHICLDVGYLLWPVFVGGCSSSCPPNESCEEVVEGSNRERNITVDTCIVECKQAVGGGKGQCHGHLLKSQLHPASPG
jgi:hypothetical protein